MLDFSTHHFYYPNLYYQRIFSGDVDYENVKDIAAIPEIEELNIGHYIVGQSIYIGMENAVKEMIRSIEGARR